MQVEEALSALRAQVGRYRALVVAFSGGVDSALLAVVAHDVLGDAALAATAVSPSLAASERAAATAFALANDLKHVEVATREQDNPDYIRNDAYRCFHCKSALLDQLEPLAAALGATVALGVNVDDLGDWRPGQLAAAERDAAFPLADAGLRKSDVRALARHLGLSVADKPAAPCLASRVAPGEAVTPEVLARVEAAETAVRALGFAVFRVRAHGTVARLEVPDDDAERAFTLRSQLDDAVKRAGFAFVALDLAPFASGRFNAARAIPLTVRR